MDRAETSRIAHADHSVAAPVSGASVARLLEHLDPPHGSRVLDLGCGSGAWLVELLARRPDLTAIGVDTHLHPDRVARANARGVGDRLTWHEGDAADWWDGEPRGRAVHRCEPRLRRHGTDAGRGRHAPRPRGRALVGDGFWDGPTVTGRPGGARRRARGLPLAPRPGGPRRGPAAGRSPTPT